MSHSLSERAFTSGNEIMAEAALRAGCTFFAGYPITPSSEIAEILAAALMRLKARKSTPLSAHSGDSSLDFSPDRSRHANNTTQSNACR